MQISRNERKKEEEEKLAIQSDKYTYFTSL